MTKSTPLPNPYIKVSNEVQQICLELHQTTHYPLKACALATSLHYAPNDTYTLFNWLIQNYSKTLFIPPLGDVFLSEAIAFYCVKTKTVEEAILMALQEGMRQNLFWLLRNKDNTQYLCAS